MILSNDEYPLYGLVYVLATEKIIVDGLEALKLTLGIRFVNGNCVPARAKATK